MLSLGQNIDALYSHGEPVDKVYSLGSLVYNRNDAPYVELDYIECTGTQYTDTGITNDGNLLIVDNVLVRDASVKEFMLFGGRSTSTNGVGLYYNDYKGILQAYGTSFTISSVSDIVGNWTELRLDVTGMWFNGIYRPRAGVFVSEAEKAPIYLDALFSIDKPDARMCRGLRGSTQIYRDGVLVFDAIPVKLLSGEVGRWDKVSNRFLSNLGSGNYIEGSISTLQSKVATLGIEPADTINDNLAILTNLGVK